MAQAAPVSAGDVRKTGTSPAKTGLNAGDVRRFGTSPAPGSERDDQRGSAGRAQQPLARLWGAVQKNRQPGADCLLSYIWFKPYLRLVEVI